MLRPVVAQIGMIVVPQHDTISPEKTGGAPLLLPGQASRAIGLDLLGFAGSPNGPADGDGAREEAAGNGDERALDEDRRRIGVVEIPPPVKFGRIVERPA